MIRTILATLAGAIALGFVFEWLVKALAVGFIVASVWKGISP